MNCHMPHTSYALFSAIRSHQIESPDIAASATHGTPNACNLCHLDKSLQWTADALSERYGTAPVQLSRQQKDISAALLWMLKGHAAQRVIAAWHAGWEPAKETAGEDWQAPFLAYLLDDPYGVVRYVAAENLRKLKGFEAFEFDFMAPADARAAKVAAAQEHWRSLERPARHGSEILITQEREIMQPIVDNLLRARDDRPVDIKE